MSARTAPALLLLCALSACAVLPGGEGQADLAATIADAYRVSSLPPAAQQAEIETAWRAYAREADARSALRLALMLSLPGTAFQDDEQAAQILAPYAASPAASDVRRYAALLGLQLDEQARQRRRVLRLRDQLVALPAAPPREYAQVHGVTELVAYAHGVSSLPPEEQRAELARAERELAAEASEYARVRVALLLSLPGTALYDEARALELLAPFAATAAVSPLQQFAALLRRQVSVRTQDRKRTAQLREQLEALRDIERSLMERRTRP